VNQLSTPLKVLTILAIALLMNSCKKFIDTYYNKDQIEIRFCKIEKVEIFSPYAETLNFSYNHLGNPVSVIQSNGPGTGTPNYLFFYDNKSRLHDVIGVYDESSYESWQRFAYNGKNQIVKDTTWIFGMMGDNPDPANIFISENRYYYDAMGRMIKVISVGLNQNTSAYHEKNYSYNTDGNLNNSGVYDNKINFNRTNKIWMFLNRNYSRNNVVAAEEYNFAGLPLKFKDSLYDLGFLNFEFNDSEITYSCK
jgi:hypothetical protein